MVTMHTSELQQVKPTTMNDGQPLQGIALKWRRYLDELQPNKNGFVTFIPFLEFINQKEKRG